MRQKIKPEHLILVFIFLFVLIFRLYFAFQVDHFNTDNAYFHLKHIENIVKERNLLTYDSLSYGGREVIYPHLFHIILALLSFGSIFFLKLIPEIFISLTVFVVYIIAKEVSGDRYAALFSTLLSSFYPILFSETLNNLSVYTIVIPLLLLMLYALLNLENKFYLWLFVVLSFLLPLLHPIALVFVVILFVYFILLSGGALTSTKLKKEAAIFSILIIVLLEFIIYKQAFLQYGAGIIWQNIPSNILDDSFKKILPLDLLIGVGLVPLILGAFGVYIGITKRKVKACYMFSAFAMTVLLLTVLRFLTISVGLMFLGLILCIFTSLSLKEILSYINNLRFNHVRSLFFLILVLLFIFSSFLPSYFAARDSNVIANSKFKQIKWIMSNTKADAVVLGNVEEGNLISYLGNRKNVIDNNFLLAPNPVDRNRDIEVIYTTASEALATNLINKYSIDIIYLSDDTMDIYNITSLNYARGSRCFDVLRNGRYYVFKC